MASTTPAGERSGAGGLRLLYLVTFLYVGGYGNFFPLWLRQNDWSATELGWLDGFRYMTVIVVTLFWGRLVDRRGDAVGVLRWIALGCLVTFLPMVWSVDFWVVLVASSIWAVFRVGQIPSLDALTLSHVGRHGGTYGRFRSWGSIGFIAGGVLLGWLVTATDRSTIPLALVGTLAVTLALVWTLRPEPTDPAIRSESLRNTVRRLLSKRS
ncbi:MAG: MFS transporter, partial [Myxococcota bacterium]|nr:MFS transporter [Myxococcota bacterium]